MRRFLIPRKSFQDNTAELDTLETRHLRNVLRLTVGSDISIFDGEGSEYIGRITAITKRSTLVTIIEKTDPPCPESPLDLTLAASLLKGDKFDLVVQKAVELGVKQLIPLHTDRCDIKIGTPGQRFERWQRIAAEATKQCGRATLLSIERITPFVDVSFSQGSGWIFTERGGGRMPIEAPRGPLTIVTGPEGGWSDDELKAAQEKRASLITLGGRILRAETAAIAITAIVQNRFGDMI